MCVRCLTEADVRSVWMEWQFLEQFINWEFGKLDVLLNMNYFRDGFVGVGKFWFRNSIEIKNCTNECAYPKKLKWCVGKHSKKENQGQTVSLTYFSRWFECKHMRSNSIWGQTVLKISCSCNHIWAEHFFFLFLLVFNILFYFTNAHTWPGVWLQLQQRGDVCLRGPDGIHRHAYRGGHPTVPGWIPPAGRVSENWQTDGEVCSSLLRM